MQTSVIHPNVWQNLILPEIRDHVTIARLARVDKNLQQMVEAYFKRTKSLLVYSHQIEASKLAKWPLLPWMVTIDVRNLSLSGSEDLFLCCVELRSLKLECHFKRPSTLFVPEIPELDATVRGTGPCCLEIEYGPMSNVIGLYEYWDKEPYHEIPTTREPPSTAGEKDYNPAAEAYALEVHEQALAEAYWSDPEHLLDFHKEEEERLAKRPCIK